MKQALIAALALSGLLVLAGCADTADQQEVDDTAFTDWDTQTDNPWATTETSMGNETSEPSETETTPTYGTGGTGGTTGGTTGRHP